MGGQQRKLFEIHRPTMEQAIGFRSEEEGKRGEERTGEERRGQDRRGEERKGGEERRGEERRGDDMIGEERRGGTRRKRAREPLPLRIRHAQVNGAQRAVDLVRALANATQIRLYIGALSPHTSQSRKSGRFTVLYCTHTLCGRALKSVNKNQYFRRLTLVASI